VKSGIFLRGFLGNSQDTRINLLIKSMSRALDAKHEVFFHLRSGTNARVQGGGRISAGGRKTAAATCGSGSYRVTLRGRQATGSRFGCRAGLARGCTLQRPSAGHAHGRAERSGRALMDVDRNITEGKKGKQGLDRNDLQTRTRTTKRKGNDKANAMVCSPSAKDERRRRKSSPELRRSRRSWGR
jgi:hypothetical protein